MDDPLPSEVFKAVGKAFRAYYNWPDIAAERMGSDKLLGRTRKEFQRKEPSLFPMLKVKSLTSSQFEPQEKKMRLSVSAVLTVLDGAERQAEAPSLFQWLSCFDIMVNTWALAGCFDVVHEGKTVKYCHWAQADQYKYEFQAKTLQLRHKHAEKAIFSYLGEVESSMRSKAIELARGTQEIPWGEALLSSLKENAHLWQEKRAMLTAYNDQGAKNSAFMNSLPTPAPFSKKAQVGSQSTRAKPPCRYFLQGTCVSGDSCRFSHVPSQPQPRSSPKNNTFSKGNKGGSKGDKKGKW